MACEPAQNQKEYKINIIAGCLNLFYGRNVNKMQACQKKKSRNSSFNELLIIAQLKITFKNRSDANADMFT